ncbi:hypothetical protein GN956_G1014 [Arapaima gigas]
MSTCCSLGFLVQISGPPPDLRSTALPAPGSGFRNSPRGISEVRSRACVNRFAPANSAALAGHVSKALLAPACATECPLRWGDTWAGPSSAAGASGWIRLTPNTCQAPLGQKDALRSSFVVQAPQSP